MRILVVEDEEKIGKMLKDGLKAKGYAVDHLNDGQKGLNRIQSSYSDYNTIILDLNLPSKNGLEICQEIRKINIF